MIDRAIALNPNSVLAWSARGWNLGMQNQPVAAIEAQQRAIRLSPFDPLAHYFSAGIAFAHMEAGRFEDAVEWADRALQVQPRYISAMRVKLVSLGHLGRSDDARDCLKRVLAIQPGLTIASWKSSIAATSAYAPEVLALFVDGLRKAGVPEE